MQRSRAQPDLLHLLRTVHALESGVRLPAECSNGNVKGRQVFSLFLNMIISPVEKYRRLLKAPDGTRHWLNVPQRCFGQHLGS